MYRANEKREMTKTRMKLGTQSRVPPSPCLSCGKINDAATVIDEKRLEAKPRPGCVTVCLTCGHIMVFTDDLTLRDPTIAEIREIAGDQRILAIQRARVSSKLTS
jgi:hypothetical protein